MGERITFVASFPPIQSAIKVGGDGARIQLDIPESELPAIVRLLTVQRELLRVTVELEDERQSTQRPD